MTSDIMRAAGAASPRRRDVYIVFGKVASALTAGMSLALLTTKAGAQVRATAGEEPKSVRVVRIDTAPVIDGKLDEAVWQSAQRIDDFHQIRPGDGATPSEPTEVYSCTTTTPSTSARACTTASRSTSWRTTCGTARAWGRTIGS